MPSKSIVHGVWPASVVKLKNVLANIALFILIVLELRKRSPALKELKGKSYMLAFDIEAYLQNRGIEYITEGKNVTAGWLEINCPFCGDDPSFHMGVSPERWISCWRCGTKGSVLKYIMFVEDCSYGKAKKIAMEFVDETLSHLKIEDRDEIYRPSKVVLPESKKLLDDHYNYLENRGFDAKEIERKYKLTATGKCRGIDSKYSYRILVPVLVNRLPVSFTALSHTSSRQRYLHCEDSRAVIPMKSLFYNIDSVRDTALIVEGVTDVWRMGDGCIAAMGEVFTIKQVLFLVRRKVLRCFVMFDAEYNAQKRAKSLAEMLSGFIKHVEIYELEIGDPGELSEEEAKKIRQDIRI